MKKKKLLIVFSLFSIVSITLVLSLLYFKIVPNTFTIISESRYFRSDKVLGTTIAGSGDTNIGCTSSVGKYYARIGFKIFTGFQEVTPIVSTAWVKGITAGKITSMQEYKQVDVNQIYLSPQDYVCVKFYYQYDDDITIEPTTWDNIFSCVFTSEVLGATKLSGVWQFEFRWVLNTGYTGVQTTFYFGTSSDRILGFAYEKSVAPPNPPVARFTYTPQYPYGTDIVTFDGSTSTPDGGTLISWNWDFGGSYTGTGVTTTHLFNSAGSYNVILTVKDDEGATATVSKTIVVSSLPTVTLDVTSADLLVGQSKTFVATITGGAGTLTYKWETDLSLLSSTSSACSYVPILSDLGTRILKVTVKDANNKEAYTTATINVANQLSLSVNPSSLSQETTVTGSIPFSSSISGGFAPYTYSWKVNTVVKGTGTVFVFYGSNFGAGIFSLQLEVKDSKLNSKLSSTITITVYSALGGSISPTGSINVYTGNNVAFSASPSGGKTSNYHYEWRLDGLKVGADSYVYSTPAFTDVGNMHMVYCILTDGISSPYTTPTTTISIINLPQPPSGLITGPIEAYDGETLTYIATASGFPLPTHSWTSSGGTFTQSMISSSESQYMGTLSVGTANYINAWVRCQLTNPSGTVYATPNPYNILIKAVPFAVASSDKQTGKVGDIITFSAGTGTKGYNLQYKWNFDDGTVSSYSSSSSKTHSFSTAKSYNVVLTVKDASGREVNSNILVISISDVTPLITIQTTQLTYPAGSTTCTISVLVTKLGVKQPNTVVSMVISQKLGIGYYGFSTSGSTGSDGIANILFTSPLLSTGNPYEVIFSIAGTDAYATTPIQVQSQLKITLQGFSDSQTYDINSGYDLDVIGKVSSEGSGVNYGDWSCDIVTLTYQGQPISSSFYTFGGSSDTFTLQGKMYSYFGNSMLRTINVYIKIKGTNYSPAELNCSVIMSTPSISIGINLNPIIVKGTTGIPIVIDLSKIDYITCSISKDGTPLKVFRTGDAGFEPMSSYGYFADYTFAEIGVYQIVVEASKNSIKVGSRQFTFTIQESSPWEIETWQIVLGIIVLLVLIWVFTRKRKEQTPSGA